MPRAGTTTMFTACAAAILRPAFFFQVTFVSETVYCWTGFGSLSWNGQTWLGIGNFAGMSMVEEGSNVQARGITLLCSGLDPTLLNEALNDYQQGLPVMVYLGLFDANNNLIASPICSWAGRTDQPTISMDGTGATISIACENRLVEMNCTNERRYTNEDQQLDYPGDLAMSFVDAIQDQSIYWGTTPSGTNNFTTGG